MNLIQGTKDFLSGLKKITRKQWFIFGMASCFLLFGVDHLAMATDELAGTTANATDTVEGSMMTYIYIIELFVALATYIKTRSMWVWIGIVVIMIATGVFEHIISASPA